MPKILMPTPLRPFAGEPRAVEVDGPTVGDALEASPPPRGAAQAPLRRRGEAAHLRQRLHERRGRPLPRKRGDAGLRGDALSIIPSIAGGSPTAAKRPRDCRALRRGDPALQPAPDHAGGRHGRAAEAEGRARARDRRRRPGLAARRSTSRRPASARIGLVDFDVVDDSNLQRQILTARRTSGARSSSPRRERLAGAQPARARRAARGRGSRRRTRSRSSGTTTSSSTAPTTSRRATSSTTPACCSASRTSTARSSASRGRRRSSGRDGARATAASIPSRRRRAWCRPAPRAACSACCRASSARSRRPRRSS